VACGGSGVTYLATVASVEEPDGTRFDFEYAGLQLRAVTSSRGYALLLEYGANGFVSKTCVLNLGSVAKPANNVCPASALATATYTYSGIDFQVTLASATQPDSNTETITYTQGSPGVSYQMGFKKPGQAAAWQTNTMVYDVTSDGEQTAVVSSQSFADGSGYSYFYDHTPAPYVSDFNFTSWEPVAG